VCVVVFGWVGEDRANVYFAGVAFEDGGGEFLEGGEGLVADVNLVAWGGFDGEGEFSVGECVVFVLIGDGFWFVWLLGRGGGWVV